MTDRVRPKTIPGPFTPAPDRERTPELTGFDATMDEAEAGTAGNGLDPYDADATGGLPRGMEADPSDPGDILPDKITRSQRAQAADDAAEGEVTARPSDRISIDPSELP